MTKAELIERHGIEWYEQYKSRMNDQTKERYHNDLEYREYHREYYKEYMKEYHKNDLNSNGKTKDSIRCQSKRVLFNKRKHTKLKGYEIHHCFGYDDLNKFIYVPKLLHNKIHRFLRDNNIDADSNHFNSIAQMINECTEYTYISA